MIRANLLPRRRRTLRAFGIAIELAAFRAFASVIGAIALAGGIVAAIDGARLHTLEARVDEARALTAVGDAERERAHRLAVAVAHLQTLARDARMLRASGNAAAVALATLGNELPPNVWLDEAHPERGAYRLVGTARDVRALGRAVVRLANQGSGATLLSLDAQRPGEVHFAVRARADGGAARAAAPHDTEGSP